MAPAIDFLPNHRVRRHVFNNAAQISFICHSKIRFITKDKKCGPTKKSFKK